ncbi:MAG: hypothetical protein K2H21_08500, partial [Muribaculaceae bacterium]|nr:hypothetical protein [Muribaculaceae bacterium]
YAEGLELLHDANDRLAAMPPDSVNPTEAVMFLGNLANLYSRMGLHEEALATNGEATGIADREGLDIRADVWRMRGLVYKNSGQTDSMFACLDRSRERSAYIADEDYRRNVRQRLEADRAYFFIENPGYAPDSVSGARSRLERLMADSESGYGHEPSRQNSTARLLVGRAYVIAGDAERGLPMMNRALEDFRRSGDTESMEWGLQLLAQSYAAACDCRLTSIYQETAMLHDSIIQGRTANRLLGMDFRYRTSQLQRDKELLEDELRIKRQRIIFISVIAVLVVAGVTAMSIMRHRNHRRQLRLKQSNIDNLLSERIALNARIEELNRAALESDTSARRHEMLDMILLERDDEQRFRKTFTDLYPGFIDRLRREYPDLTSGNELLCMLIALNRRNDEIALALGISRESVATSRYRLRTRFNLDKGVELNDFIQSRLPGGRIVRE